MELVTFLSQGGEILKSRGLQSVESSLPIRINKVLYSGANDKGPGYYAVGMAANNDKVTFYGDSNLTIGFKWVVFAL